MLKSIKVSIRDTFIFGFGNVAVKIAGFVLIPLYTNKKYFSVDDFGVIGILDISGLILIALFSSSLPQSLTRWFWTKENNCTQKDIFFMTIATQVIMSLLFCLLLIPFSGSLSEMIFDNTFWSRAIIFITIASALQGINNIMNTLMRLQARSVLFMATNLIKLLIVIFLTIYFVIFGQMGVEGIYLAQILGNLLIILYLVPYSVRNSSVHFNMPTWKSMMNYGFPLVFASVSTVMLNVIDRFSLQTMATLKSVAIYTLAYKISSSLKLVVVDTIKLAVFPQMIRRIDSPDNKRFYSKAMLYSSFVVMFGIIGVSLFSPEVIKFLSKTTELWGAYLLVPVLSISAFFINMREVSIYGLIITKKTKKISLIIIVSTVLNLLLNILLIPRWNVMGAAFATLISQFLYMFMMQFMAQKAFFIPYENKKMILMFITGTALSFAGLFLTGMHLFPRILIKLIFLASFPVILYIFNFYENIEIQVIKGFYNKWSNFARISENLKSLKNIKGGY